MVNIFLPFTRNPRAPAILTSQSHRDCVEKSGKQSASKKISFNTEQVKQFPTCSPPTNATVTGKNEHRMMSPKRWILLLIFYISYLMFGASIYYHIEHRLEAEQIQEDQKERARIYCKFFFGNKRYCSIKYIRFKI